MKQDDSEGDTASKQPNSSRHDMVVASLIVNTCFFFGIMATVPHCLPSLKLYRYLASWHRFEAPTQTHICTHTHTQHTHTHSLADLSFTISSMILIGCCFQMNLTTNPTITLLYSMAKVASVCSLLCLHMY